MRCVGNIPDTRAGKHHHVTDPCMMRHVPLVPHMTSVPCDVCLWFVLECHFGVMSL